MVFEVVARVCLVLADSEVRVDHGTTVGEVLGDGGDGVGANGRVAVGVRVLEGVDILDK